MIQNLTLGLLLLASQLAFSQTTRLLKGKIVDSGSGEPLPYASISIVGTTKGSASNDAGDFQLLIQQPNLKIHISSIGYISKAFNVDSLLALREVLLPIQTDNKLLDEIIITSEEAKPTEILQEALNNIARNYYMQDFNVEAYSKIETIESNKKNANYTLETIMLGYYNGYKPGSTKKFKIIEKRESGADPLKGTKFKYWPSFELYNVDLLTSPFAKGVFNPEHWDKFQFTRQEIALYDKDTVFVMNYNLPNPSEKVTGFGNPPKFYKGTVYITTNNYAVVRHTLHTTAFDMDIIYKKIGDSYFPYVVKGTREQEIKVQKVKQNVVITNMIIINNIVLKSPKAVDPKENEWDVSPVKYNPNYWETYSK
jgi:hypothetical protein